MKKIKAIAKFLIMNYHDDVVLVSLPDTEFEEKNTTVGVWVFFSFI